MAHNDTRRWAGLRFHRRRAVSDERDRRPPAAPKPAAPAGLCAIALYFKLHVPAAFRNGVTREEIREVLLQPMI
jgi:alkylhydroperoxidase/carboxymuconolactone decarboxylase family protein YurZ